MSPVSRFEHLEALADLVDTPERFEQRAHALRRHAEHLEVHVLRFTAEEPVPDPTADDERATAFVPNGSRDCRSAFDERIGRHVATIGLRPHVLTRRAEKPGVSAASTASAFDRRYG
jgi:hypothetical protein